MGNKSSQPAVENKTKLIQYEGKIDDTMEEDSITQEKNMEETNAKVAAIEKSLQTDSSIPNTVEQMAKLIELEEGSPMGKTVDVITQMGNHWDNFNKDLKTIKPIVGEKEVADINTLRTDYFILLAETKPIIAGLIEQSQSKIEDIESMIRVINKAINNSKESKNELSKVDNMYYEEGIESLRQWIDQSKLTELSTKWTQMTVKLKEKEQTWKEMFTTYYAAFNKKSKWKKFALFFAGVTVAAVAVGACVALVVFTAGIGAAAIAGVGAVASGFILGAGIGGGVGMTGLAAAIICGHQLQKKQKIHQSLKNIQNMINEMLDTSEAIRDSVVKINCESDRVGVRLNTIKNTEILEKMEKNLNLILQYLEEYNKQGRNVMDACDKTVAKFLER